MMTTTDSGSQVILDQNPAFLEPNIDIVTDNFNKAIRLTNFKTPTIEVKLTGGNIFFTTNGLIDSSSPEVLLNADNVFSRNIRLINEVTLDPAAAVYNELNNAVLPGLGEAVRVNIVPDVAGTTINSIITDLPNPDGAPLWIANLGTAVGQILTLANQSGAGTVGGLIIGPALASYVIPAGGGVAICFSASVLAGAGAWLVQGV